MRRTANLSTLFLIIINVWFGFLVAEHSWEPTVIASWGGMTSSMPSLQALSTFPPFNLITMPQLNHLPHIITPLLVTPMHGFGLILLRALYASFLHFSWGHLFSNMLVLFFVGRLFNQTNYRGLLIPVYALTGIISMVSAYYIQPTALTAGASGAIFGIMGAMVMLSIRSHYQASIGNMDAPIASAYQAAGKYAFGLLIINIITTMTVPNISIVGHFSGLIAGLIIGIAIPLRYDY